MMQISEFCTDEYFGAMNSYHGFISYFDTIFPPESFEKIYVIKGGPGCGKSSFMKKLLRNFPELDTRDAIHCSSDTDSLDGIILGNKETKIAVIDGTAPHEFDAKYPAVSGVILNFSEFIDERWLEAKRDEIFALNKEKASEYKTAYSYLTVAGECYSRIYNIHETLYKKTNLSKIAFDIIKKIKGVNQGDGITKTIYAFGKDGVKRLDSSRNLNKNHINVNIPPQYYYHFTDDIKRTLDLLEIEHVAYLSCPEGKYEAFVIPGADVLIGSFNASESSERTINLSIDAPLVKERSRVLSELEEAAKEEAIRHFRLASELHFRLEKIYVNSMNFDKLDSFYNETLEKIKKNLY